MCESGGNYAIDTGNGYYGAYQFSLGTWRAYGGAGYPHQASPAEQDYRARLLYRARGWSPWPGCAARLGLVADPAYGRTSVPVRPARPARPASRPAAGSAVRPGSRSGRRPAVDAVRPPGRPAPATPTVPAPPPPFEPAGPAGAAEPAGPVLVAPALAAPRIVRAGREVRLTGTARAGVPVQVRLRPAGSTAFRLAAEAAADGAGRWSVAVRLVRSGHLVALADGKRSPAVAVRVLPTGPSRSQGRALDAGAEYRFAGRTDPGATVVLFVRSGPERSFTPRRWTRADRAGRWATVWHATSSFAYFARAGLRARGVVTRTEPAARDTAVTAGATATRFPEPRRVRVAGTAAVSRAGRVGTGRSAAVSRQRVRPGRYTFTAAAAPASAFTYYVLAPDGRLSQLGTAVL